MHISVWLPAGIVHCARFQRSPQVAQSLYVTPSPSGFVLLSSLAPVYVYDNIVFSE